DGRGMINDQPKREMAQRTKLISREPLGTRSERTHPVGKTDGEEQEQEARTNGGRRHHKRVDTSPAENTHSRTLSHSRKRQNITPPGSPHRRGLLRQSSRLPNRFPLPEDRPLAIRNRLVPRKSCLKCKAIVDIVGT